MSSYYSQIMAGYLDHEFPCPMQDDSNSISMEPLSEKRQRSKCCVSFCIYLMEHISQAINIDQDLDNLKILCEYLGKSHYMTYKYCTKLYLKIPYLTTPWKMTIEQKCIWHWQAIIGHMESVNTCIHVSPIMWQPEAHDYLYKLLGKKIKSFKNI